MSKKKQKAVPQRNMVAKYAREFNKCTREMTDKQKQKHKKPKHKNKDAE